MDSVKGSDTLSENFARELIASSIDLGIDYTELALDSLIEGGILEEVPVIKTIFSAINIGNTVKDRFFAKKLLTFLQQFHSNTIPKDKLDEFQRKLDSESKYKEKVIEHLLILNERFLEIEKSKILANLFVSHIEGKMDWGFFQELASCLDRIFPRTIPILHQLSKTNFQMVRNHEIDTIDVHAILTSAGLGIQQAGPPFTISTMAKDLYELGKMEKLV